jgi:hypothetical protein
MRAPMVHSYSRHVGLIVGTIYRVARKIGTFGTTSRKVEVLRRPWYHKLVKYRDLGVAMHAPMVHICSRHVGLYVATMCRVAKKLGTFGTTSQKVELMQMLWYHKFFKYRNLGVAMRTPMVYSYSRYAGLLIGTMYRVAR